MTSFQLDFTVATTLYRIDEVFSDGSRTGATYKTQDEALNKAIQLALTLPKGARLEQRIITFSEPTIIFTAK